VEEGKTTDALRKLRKGGRPIRGRAELGPMVRKGGVRKENICNKKEKGSKKKEKGIEPLVSRQNITFRNHLSYVCYTFKIQVRTTSIRT
jgi:hypothetical protein